MRKKICIITGARSEYGLLKPLIDKISVDNCFVLQIIVTGMHLSPEFGLTYKEIENDNIKINEKIEILLSSDTSVGVLKSMGLALISLSEALQRLSPDIVTILGDRFETLSAVIAAFTLKIPIAHLHGGEITEGAIDEAFRHSITKMSYFHFTSTEEYKKRVIQLGESPDRVFNVGAIGIDNIKRMKLLDKQNLENELKIKFKKKNLLITFHPVTLEKNSSEKQFENLLMVLNELDETLLIFTKSNADSEGRIINKMIDDYVNEKDGKACAFTSLGSLKYLSVMQYVDAIVGNSSSGIIEAPSFKIGTINIGDRQRGRINAKSIINCSSDIESISDSFCTLYSQEFQNLLKTFENPYGNGESSEKNS